MEDEKPNEDDEAYFQRTADGFQDQFKGIVNKYQLLMMKESMVSVCDPPNHSSISINVFRLICPPNKKKKTNNNHTRHHPIWNAFCV